MSSSHEIQKGATVIITHHVRPGMDQAYASWLAEISPISRSRKGHLDLQVIRPIAGMTTTYTIIIRYDTHQHLLDWMLSPERKQMIEKVRPLLCKDDNFEVRSGLDFWFMPQGASNATPKRWKQWLLTWSAIWPLSLAISPVITWLLNLAGIPDDRILRTLLTSAIAVALMVYVIMPRYTKLVQGWLYKSA